MRKLLFTAVLLSAMTAALAQPAKWYASVSSGFGWGGPTGAIKNKFEKAGFNQTSSSVLLFFSYNTDYPRVNRGVPLQLRAGRHLKGNRSVFVQAGTSAAGEVTGFKQTAAGIETSLGIFGGSIGSYVSIRHKVTQVAVGLEHTVPNSRMRLGYAPAAYIMRYHNIYSSDAGKKTAFVPGVALSARLPLGKEKRRIGMELVTDLNLAPAATIKEQYYGYMDNNGNNSSKLLMPAFKVSMVHGTVGLALSYRQK